jgi:hypothetical protein
MTQRGQTATGPGGLPRHPRGAAGHEAGVPEVGRQVPEDPRHPRGVDGRDQAGVPRAGDEVPEHPRHPRVPAGLDAGQAPNVAPVAADDPAIGKARPAGLPSTRGAGFPPPHDPPPADVSSRPHRYPAVGGPSKVHHHPRGDDDCAAVPPSAALVHGRGTDNAHGGATALTVRMEVRLVGGEAGRALAAAQGRALAALLASLGETEVGQGEEVSP